MVGDDFEGGESFDQGVEHNMGPAPDPGAIASAAGASWKALTVRERVGAGGAGAHGLGLLGRVVLALTESELTGMGIEEPTTWESYEDVARFLLEKLGDKLGLGLERVEGKQKLVGESGAEWEIDGKGVKADGGAIVVVECRRYTTSRVKQSAVASLAWTISDLGRL